MKAYDSYKDSEVEWIGEIPSHWRKSRFKFVSDLFTGNSLNDSQKLKYESDNQNDIPYVSSKDIDINLQTVNYNSGLRIPKNEGLFRVSAKGSFLMVIEGGSAGKKMVLLEQDVCFVNKLCSFSSVENTKFQYYFIQSSNYQDKFRLSLTGLIGGVSISTLKNFEVILPPLSEQQQIVSFLDTKTSLIDSLIEKTKQKIKLLRENRLKLIEEVVLNPNVKRVRLEYVVDLVKRPIEREDNESYTKIGMYNWGRGIFKYPSELGSDLGDSNFYYIKEGDLLLSGQFSWEGAVSLVEKEEDNCIASHRFHILNGQEGEVLNEYLWSYLTSQEGHFLLNENSNGSAGRNRPLNIGELLKEKIPIPKMEVQMEIKRLVIESINYKKYSEQRTKLLKEYRQSLISQVVTGKIKVTEDA